VIRVQSDAYARHWSDDNMRVSNGHHLWDT
jgi:hypothetical protein